MVNTPQIKDRRTSVDAVYDHLYEEIASLKLMPGDKISEADIAAQFGVSRQPVRDAFSRLEGMDLLVIRPQRATEVKRFSLREITKSRFVRAAVEAKVLWQAAHECDVVDAATLDASLERQRKAVEAKDYEAFGLLDYDFHRTLCDIAKADFAFEVLSAEKAKVDRLCRLSLAKEDRMPELLKDHEAIAEMVKLGNAAGAVEVGMVHLSRLDATISAVSASNARYFDS
jgi:DNA-binding GntR family transcriptional regulator